MKYKPGSVITTWPGHRIKSMCSAERESSDQLGSRIRWHCARTRSATRGLPFITFIDTELVIKLMTVAKQRSFHFVPAA